MPHPHAITGVRLPAGFVLHSGAMPRRTPRHQGGRPSRGPATRAQPRTIASAPGAAQPPEPPGRSIWAVWVLAVAYVAVYSALSALRYRFYLYADFDLAIFAQAIDGVLHGRLHSSIRGMDWLGDHSSLVLFLVAPLYAIARHPMTLLVLQSAALGAGAFPVYALAWRELGPPALAITCVVIYLLHPALGYANLFEFHPELLATPALLASFYFLRAGRLRGTLGWAVVALLCREDVMLVVLTMALYALTLRRPRRTRFALGLAAAAVASAVVTWGVLRPAFTHGEADYARVYLRWGRSVPEAALRMAQDPLRVAVSLVSTPGNPYDSLIKLQYHTALLAPLALLPLFSPMTLAIALPALMEHLLSWRTAQHTILCQYTALVMPFAAAAAVMGMRNVRSWFRGRWSTVLIGVPLGAAVGGQLFFGPLLSDGRYFEVKTLGRHLPTGEERTMARLRDSLLARVPPSGGVVASFELLNRLTARDSVHSFHHVMAGRYTFSSRPYPIPTGVSALIADVGSTNIVAAVDPGTSGRLREFMRTNRLVPVAAAGDLILLVADGRDTVELISSRPCPPQAGGPVGFDREIAFLGGGLVDSIGRPGGLVELGTCWRRTGAANRQFSMRLRLLDATGRTALEHTRDLGYLFFPPPAWREGVAVREDYRLVLPEDLPAGDYRLTVSVVWRGRGASGECTPDDPSRYSADAGIELGRIRVLGR